MTIETQQSKLASALKERTNTLKTTYKSLAAKTGLSVNTIKSVLDGKFCNTKSLLAICDAVGWNIADLVDASGLTTGEATVPQEEAPQEESAEEAAEEKTDPPVEEEKSSEQKLEEAVESMEEEEAEIL